MRLAVMRYILCWVGDGAQHSAAAGRVGNSGRRHERDSRVQGLGSGAALPIGLAQRHRIADE